MEIESIENSNIIFHKDYIFYVKDYYNYIVKLLRKILKNNDYNINILINYDYNINNINKNIKIGINFEHTLVKIGGRSAENSLPGNISIMDNNKYLVRIDGYENLIKNDIIIDYSIPNLININNTSGNCEIWIAMYRGNADGIIQFLQPNEYIYGVKNNFFNPNKKDYWLN